MAPEGKTSAHVPALVVATGAAAFAPLLLPWAAVDFFAGTACGARPGVLEGSQTWV